ncbi:MAG: GNAT family N-acetyltransferase [Chloroflexi bacterium]|nr:GNAT family N-acetyltransferase [Chloroflexota bacterium]
MSWEKFWPFSKNDENDDYNVKNDEIFIKGKFTQLRSKKIEDANNDYNWRLDNELSNLDATKPINLSYKEFLKYHKEDVKFPNLNSLRMAIDTLHGKHIGNCMFYDINTRTLQAEFGIMIGNKEYWNNGYGSDAMKNAVGYFFNNKNINHIYLHTLVDNIRAQKSFQKCGFKKIKNITKENSEFIYMEIWRKDWEIINIK